MKKVKILIFILFFLLICPTLYAENKTSNFLNINLSYKVVIPKDTSSLPFSDKTKAVTVEFKNENFYSSDTYYIKNELTDEKLRIIEYDVLIHNFIRQNVCPVNILNHMSKNEIYELHREMYLGYQNFKEMKVPEKVREIHERYVQFVEPMKDYLDFKTEPENKKIFKNSTIVYRIMSSLNSYSQAKIYQQANLKLFNLLKDKQIKPAR